MNKKNKMGEYFLFTHFYIRLKKFANQGANLGNNIFI